MIRVAGLLGLAYHGLGRPDEDGDDSYLRDRDDETYFDFIHEHVQGYCNGKNSISIYTFPLNIDHNLEDLKFEFQNCDIPAMNDIDQPSVNVYQGTGVDDEPYAIISFNPYERCERPMSDLDPNRASTYNVAMTLKMIFTVNVAGTLVYGGIKTVDLNCNFEDDYSTTLSLGDISVEDDTLDATFHALDFNLVRVTSTADYTRIPDEPLEAFQSIHIIALGDGPGWSNTVLELSIYKILFYKTTEKDTKQMVIFDVDDPTAGIPALSTDNGFDEAVMDYIGSDRSEILQFKLWTAYAEIGGNDSDNYDWTPSDTVLPYAMGFSHRVFLLDSDTNADYSIEVFIKACGQGATIKECMVSKQGLDFEFPEDDEEEEPYPEQ